MSVPCHLPQVAKEQRPTTPEDTAAFEGLVASLYGWVSALMPALRPRQCSMALWSVARLELFNEELVVALTKRADEVRVTTSAWKNKRGGWRSRRALVRRVKWQILTWRISDCVSARTLGEAGGMGFTEAG